MRRNIKTLIKYAIVIGLFIMLGPTTIRYLFKTDDGSIPVHPRGLPVDPDAAPGDRVIHKKKSFITDAVHMQQQNNKEDNGQLKDWHNYELIASLKARTGPGEQGMAVIIPASEEKAKQDLFKVNGFNGLASDKIALDRALKDIRHPDCRNKKYLPKLPKASIVVPFHNEHWTTLLRTAVTVIKQSPPELLEEVILVDDYSTKEFLKDQLDEHLANNYDGKVKVVRAKKREGLIRTRLLGAKHAKGDVIIFLDSHCEATINWLPPLLDPIARDYRTVVCPFIDVIDFETFAYRAQDEGARGAFDWEFFYKRLPRLPGDASHPADPFDSPVMAGGLFAISKKWFWELGGYDPGLDIWGGEQYELSFKLWQCGGKMVDTPCSRVGHIYRKFAPFPNPGIGDFVGRNYRRVAEVWMDEYAEYLYSRRPHYRQIDPGDLTEQRQIREKLQCKPFKWFMEEVAFDLVKHYPPVEPPSYAEGEIRNVAANMCIDTRFKGANERFGIEPCIKDNPAGAGGEQQFELTWHKDIRPRKRNVCFDVSQSIPKAPVILFNCHGMQGNQYFKYNLDTQQLFHPVSNQCLDCDKGAKEIYMSQCDSNSDTQKWKMDKISVKEVRDEWKA